MSTQELYDQLRQHTNFLITQWKSEGQDKTVQTVAFLDTVNSWWSKLFADTKYSDTQADVIKYLLNSVNDFVEIALKTLGTDKLKFTDLIVSNMVASFAKVYDATITLSWYFKPFSKQIRTLVIETMCPILIEFLINKYIFGGST